MTCQNFTWVGNTFDLSLEGDGTCIQINCQEASEGVIEESHFSNDGNGVGRFFALNHVGAWKFHKCSFTSIKTLQDSGEGTAILVNAQTNGVTDLEVTDSNFTDLSCYGNGGAIHVAGISFSLARCCFDNCESRSREESALGGSGGVYIECTARGEIEDCTFINNTAAINGQSLQIMIPHDASALQVNVSNCTFKSHESPSVLWFGQYETEDHNTLGISTFQYTIFNCTFQDNAYADADRKYGLVMARSTVGLSYEYCIFRGNRGGLVSLSPVEAASTPPSLSLSDCSFEECSGTGLVFAAEGASVGPVSFKDCDFKSCKALIIQFPSLQASLALFKCSFEECTGEANEMIGLRGASEAGQKKMITIDKCSFTGCRYASGMIAISAAGVRQLDISNNQFTNCHSTASSSILLTTAERVSEVVFNHNNVSDCTGTAGQSKGSILTIHSENISLCENSFHLTGDSVAIIVDVTARSSIVQDTLFSISPPVDGQLQTGESLAIIGLSCQAEIEFYNCCFTRSTEELEAGYVAMESIGGKVIFSDVCFDVPESQAIKYTNEEEKENVEFSGGNREGFFVHCQCWEPIKTATDETSYLDDLETLETSESDELDQETSESDELDQQTSESDELDQQTSESDELDQQTSESDELDQQTSESDELDQQTSESDGTDPETSEVNKPGSDQGDDDKTNAGLIAGAVTGAIAAVAVVVVVVILLLRRKHSPEYDDSMADEDELTEETAASSSEAVATTGEWKAPTAETPLFSNPLKEADEHELFDSVFEEEELN